MSLRSVETRSLASSPRHGAVLRHASGVPARFPGGLREVAPRTWAWLQPNGGLGESNAGLIVGDGESLLRRHAVGRAADAADARRDGAVARGRAAAAGVRHPSRRRPLVGQRAARRRRSRSSRRAACDRAMRAEAPPRVLARDGGDGPGAAAARPAASAPSRGAATRSSRRSRGAACGCALRRPHGSRHAATLDVGGRERARARRRPDAHARPTRSCTCPTRASCSRPTSCSSASTPIMWHGPVETWLAALDTLLRSTRGLRARPRTAVRAGRGRGSCAAYWRWLRDGVREQRAAGRSAGEAARELLRSPEHARWAALAGPRADRRERRDDVPQPRRRARPRSGRRYGLGCSCRWMRWADAGAAASRDRAPADDRLAVHQARHLPGRRAVDRLRQLELQRAMGAGGERSASRRRAGSGFVR